MKNLLLLELAAAAVELAEAPDDLENFNFYLFIDFSGKSKIIGRN